jgi:membrane carboxypeptidase/penicillin-binding protein PbpC
VPTTIDSISIPTNIKEGQPIQLSATATTAANNTLTYNWYINNSTTPIVGKTINYQFADNGIYPVKLNVIDNSGTVTTQSVNVTVNNVAPTIGSISKPATIKEGRAVTFAATAT